VHRPKAIRLLAVAWAFECLGFNSRRSLNEGHRLASTWWTPGTQMFGCPRNRGNFTASLAGRVGCGPEPGFGFFLNGKNQRVCGRRHIEPNDIPNLLNEFRSAALAMADAVKRDRTGTGPLNLAPPLGIAKLLPIKQLSFFYHSLSLTSADGNHGSLGSIADIRRLNSPLPRPGRENQPGKYGRLREGRE